LCGDFLHNICLQYFPSLEELGDIVPQMHVGLHVKQEFLLSDFNGTSIFSTDFREYTDIELLENPSIGSRFVSRGWTDRRTDMMQAIVAFRSFANEPKNCIMSQTQKDF
jgi:hypothetical protein